MIKRIALIAGSVVATVTLLSSLGLWAFLSWWAPVKGKARLIAALEQGRPISVAIGSMRYELLRGFVLADVRVVDRASQEVWGAIPAMHAQAAWLLLPLTQSLRFRGRATLESPAQTTLAFSGRYRLGDRSLVLNVQTDPLPVRSLHEPLTRYVPAPLADGTVRVQLHINRPAQGLPTITARVQGTGVVWDAAPWHARGDLTVNGTASPPSQPGGRWSVQALVTLSDATLEGLAIAGPITQMGGSARIMPDRVEIDALTGTMLGSPWTLTGTVTLLSLAVEAVVRSRAPLAAVAAAVPHLSGAWQPEGTADVRAVCRGPLAPAPFLDCFAHAEFAGVTLGGAKVGEPVTDLAGRVAYDALARRLEIERLTGRFQREPFTVSGAVRMADPVEFALRLAGILPLNTVARWLPAEGPVSDVGGAAALDLELTGSTAAAQLSGAVELRDVAMRFATPAIRVEGLSGSVQIGRERIEIPEATLRLNDEPLTLRAMVIPPPGGLELAQLALARVSTTVESPRGRLRVDGRLEPQELVIEEGRLAIAESRLAFRGTVSRRPERPSGLALSGTVELADLGTLPFVLLPDLEAWKLEGAAEVEATFQGRLSDWMSATIRSEIRAPALRVREIPLEQLVCTVEQQQRVLRVRVPSALLASGKLTGELAVDHRPETQGYVLQANLIGLQLATLAQSIPAWRSRSLAGQVSAHALLSGRWAERATWRGEGWLNASGERLGDLPLLEKVFRGLFGVLADRLGLELLRRAQVTEASGRWRLAGERFTTEDLRLAGAAGLEPIALYANGSVGFDQTLDFIIEPELSEVTVLQAPTTSSLASAVLKAAGQFDRLRRLTGRHRLTGTLKNPEYRFEFSMQEIFRQLAPGPVDFLQNIFDAVR